MTTLKDRFQGAVLGAVFGDCLGAEAEYVWGIKPCSDVVAYYEEVKKEVSEKEITKGSVLYTDDTCMTFDLGVSLVKNEEFKAEDVAKNFSETFFASTPQRFYGGSVGGVFHKLKALNYSGDVYKPAAEQFQGSGSYGNGSSMRVTPATLFHHNDVQKIAELATLQSKITHANPLGIVGAILQALCVEKVLKTEKIEDPAQFCDELMAELKQVTPHTDAVSKYQMKIDIVKKFLTQKSPIDALTINKTIGTGVTALEAVPAAILGFLYTLDKNRVPEICEYNGLVRAAIFSVSFSQDSDTIGSMAASIAGAYYGVDKIPEEWKFACEGSHHALMIADDLYDINQSKK